MISLRELENSLKEYIGPNEINFKELQHILDAFDINNDGKVTIKEYQSVVKKYAAKDSEKDRDIVAKVIKACRNNGMTLKKAFSQCSFIDDCQIVLNTALRKIKSASGLEKNEVNELLNIVKTTK